jgi:hypothetical protein
MHGADDHVITMSSIPVTSPDRSKQLPVSSSHTHNQRLSYSPHDRSASSATSKSRRDRSASPKSSDHSPRRHTSLRRRTPPHRKYDRLLQATTPPWRLQDHLLQATIAQAHETSEYWRTYKRCEDIKSKIYRSYDGPADLRSRIRIAQYQQAREDWNAVVVLPRPARNMELDELDEPTKGASLLELDEHAVQIAGEKAERLARFQALVDWRRALATMPVFVKAQETVVVGSDSELPLPQPVAQHQEDVDMANEPGAVKPVTHGAQKDEMVVINFQDSGFFDGDDTHNADDEELDFSSARGIDADDDAFTAANQIETANIALQDTPAEPVHFPNESIGKPSYGVAYLQETPTKPVPSPTKNVPYEEWQELGGLC